MEDKIKPMSEPDFKALLRQYEADYNRLLSKTYADFARSNDPVKDGDIVTGNGITIRVHARKAYTNHCQNTLPCMMYHGIRLKKDGTQFKSGEFAWVHQSNLEMINGKSIKSNK